MRRRVLIFHAGALGDFLLTWPLALAVSRLMPQHRVAYVTTGEKGELARRVLRVEAVDVEQGWHTLHADMPIDARSLKLLDNTQTVFGIGLDTAWAQRVRKAGVPNVHTIVPPVRWGGTARAIDSTAEQLEPGLASGVQSAIRLIETRGLLATRKPTGSIVLHVGSGSPRKNWPHFVQLAQRLREAGRSVRVIAGEVEADTLNAASLGGLHVLHTLPQLLETLETAGAFVGNDTGPGHLAAMLGVPTVSLFGPTSDPQRWSPVGPHVRVLTGGSMEEINPNLVAQTVLELT